MWVTGGAGFIGSHLMERLLAEGHAVTAIDNLARGSLNHLTRCFAHPNFRFIRQDLADLAGAREALKGTGRADMVWHMAANSDIPAGVADATVDFRDTFLTTFHTLLLMREHGIPRIAFASTSAVYGEHAERLSESTGPLFPISNYGAMKLASEAAISAAVESYLERAWLFRFPNVVGAPATHGIIYDLLLKLRKEPNSLEVLGDGTQKKPYLHVAELVDAMLFIVRNARERLNCFNIGPLDDGITVSDIAASVVRTASPGAAIRYTGGNKGWVGDVPRFQYSVDRLLNLGWRPECSSAQAIERAVGEIYSELQALCSSSS